MAEVPSWSYHIPEGMAHQEVDFSSATQTTRSQDTRDVPLYAIAEAARYLHIAPATLRSWVVGRPYTVKGGERYFEPLIRLPDISELRLSFLNLIEAHNLRALRTRHRVSIRAVRQALDVAEQEYGVNRLLTSHELSAGAGELFLNSYGELISLNRSGQIALKRILDAYLERVEWDTRRKPSRLYPFLMAGISEPKVIAIDPRIGFGRPILLRKGISTAAIAERVDAGEDVVEVAWDYELEPAEVEDALIYERAA